MRKSTFLLMMAIAMAPALAWPDVRLTMSAQDVRQAKFLHLKTEPAPVPSCASWEEGTLIDNQHAWVSLIRTVDAGNSWERLSLSQSDLRALELNVDNATPLVYEGLLPTFFSDLLHGWLFPAAPRSGRVWRTNDGGATWMPNAEAFESVELASASKGWAVASLSSDRKQNYTSVDGGQSWSACGPVLPDTVLMEAPYFLDGDHGWVVQYARECADCVAEYFILATNDGGCNWESLWKATSNLSDSSRFFFLTPELGWLAAGNAGLFQTRDAGRNWKRIGLANGAQNVRSVFFSDRAHGWLVDLERRFYQTNDGGHSWSPVRDAKISGVRTADGRAWKEAILLQLLVRAGCR